MFVKPIPSIFYHDFQIMQSIELLKSAKKRGEKLNIVATFNLINTPALLVEKGGDHLI